MDNNFVIRSKEPYSGCWGVVFHLLSICEIKKGENHSIFILIIKCLDTDNILEIVVNANCFPDCCEDVGFATELSDTANNLDFYDEVLSEDEEIYLPYNNLVGNGDIINVFNTDSILNIEYATCNFSHTGDEGGYVKFTVSAADNSKVLWDLKIHNIHNGYYSHNFDMVIKEGKTEIASKRYML